MEEYLAVSRFQLSFFAVDYANPLAIGLNCGFGAEHLSVWLHELSDMSNLATIFYPNAGLPNELGEYDQTPEVMAAQVSRMLADGLVNIVGGCCGTTPEHIRMLAEEAKKYRPRKIYERNKSLVLSGMDSLIVSPSVTLSMLVSVVTLLAVPSSCG